jgi:O-glycosyl hydrolase
VGAQDLTGGAGRRTWSRLAAIATAIAATATVTGPASAGTVTQAERTTVKAAGLTGAEHRAITLESISATADPGFGLIVTATFRGNVERYLGQGGLAQGRVALVLTPTRPTTPSAELTDEGGGFALKRVPITHGRARTVEVFSPERVLHRRTPPGAGVVRSGTQITFYLGPPALGQFAALELEVFVRNGSRPAEIANLAVDQSELSYTQLTIPSDALTRLIAAGIDPELRAQRTAHAAIAKALSRQRRPPSITRAALSLTSRREARLRAEAGALGGLLARLNALISARTPPPPPPPSPPAPSPSPQPNVEVVQTDPALSQSMAAQPGLTTSSTPPQGVAETIGVNPQLRYQTFRGLGAAMTDSSAYVFSAMPAADRAALIQNLFGEPNPGSSAPAIHLNFLRVGIGATGAMTVGPAYSYDDNPPGGTDPSLDYFALNSEDTSRIIPTLQQVLQTNPDLEILANPWSPPAWMKSNDSLGNSNHGGGLLSQYYQSYADYFVKFIQQYTQAGIPIDAITPANEPTSDSGGTAYPGLNFPESDEAQFIANNLEPALTQAGLHTKIYGNDLSWDRYAGYASLLASDANAGPDLAGIAWHCYFGSPTAMSQLNQTNPNLDQIVDECSPEIRAFGTPEFLISTLRNWASVVAAWSVALEPDGQPIQTPNSCGGCRGLVSVDPSTGAVTYRTEYYQFGQVSGFVQPGARRVDSPNFVTYTTNGSNIETISSGLDDVAFLNPDGSKVLIAYNNSSAAIPFGVASDGSYFSYTIPAGAMTTFLWR